MSNVTFQHGSGNTATTYTVDDVSKGLPVQSLGVGATSDAVATTDTGTFSLISLFKRLLQKLTAGILVVSQWAVTSGDWKYVAASGGIVDTSDVVLKAAAGVNFYNTITSLQMINTDATVGTEVVIKDGSTIIWRGFAPASIALVTQPSIVDIKFNPPLVSSSNTALNAACITTSSQTYINAQGTVVS